jgi:hypothetical protein
VHALRARLPRGAGQRRDRLRVPRRGIRRSCSIWTTRWARRPASRAANACRRARPARSRPRRTPISRRSTEGGRRLPVLRRRLPAHVSRQRQHDRPVEGRDGPANRERCA